MVVAGLPSRREVCCTADIASPVPHLAQGHCKPEIKDLLNLMVPGVHYWLAIYSKASGVPTTCDVLASQDADPVAAPAAQQDAKTPGPHQKQPLQEQPRDEGAAAEARTPAAALKSEGPRASPHNPYTPAAHPTPPSAAW